MTTDANAAENEDLRQSKTAGNNVVIYDANDKTNNEKVVNNETIDLSSEQAEDNQSSIQFNFDTASPRTFRNNAIVSLLSDDKHSEPEENDDLLLVSDTKVFYAQPHHHNEDGCCKGKVAVESDETYENEKFEWTESCSAINDVLPPSFSRSYLYVKVKTDDTTDTMYIPGVSIINSTRESRREPEIYLCAVKCAKANNLNFFYAKTKDVEDFFKGMSIK